MASSLLIAVLRGGGRRVVRLPQLPVSFGRGRDCEVCLDDPLISRHHCRLLHGEGGVELVDLDSVNGTQVDGADIRRVMVRRGQSFLLGSTEIELLALPGPEFKPEPQPVPESPPAPELVPVPALVREAPPDPGSETASAAWSGRELRGCRIFEAVGKGGFATVYRARQVSLDRDVAIKILDPRIAERPQVVKAFHQEARAAAALAHPNLVQVFDLGEEDGQFFSIMEFLPGGSLEQDLQDHGPLPWRDAARAAYQCALALEHARLKGVLHHDIKPGNLLLGADGSVKLADLGLAGALAEGGRTLSAGSPHYMAPERIRKRALDARSDLYSLGCTLYRLLTGRHVFEKKGVKEILRAHCSEEPPALAGGGPGLPDVLASLVSRLLRKDPEERPAHPGAVAQELERLLRSSGGVEGAASGAGIAGSPRSAARVSLPKASAATARGRKRERNKWKLIVGIPCTLLLAFFAFRGHKILLEWGKSLRQGVSGEAPASPAFPEESEESVESEASPPVLEPVLEGGAVPPESSPPAPLSGTEPAGSAFLGLPESLELPEPSDAERRKIELALNDFRDPVGAGFQALEAEQRLLAHGLPAARSVLAELAVTNWSQPRSVSLAARYHQLLTALLPTESAEVRRQAGVWKPTSTRQGVAFVRAAEHDRGIAAAWHLVTLGEVPLALR